MAQAIRWVNESFLPAALSDLRRASSVPTSSVRNEVAVGIDRDSFMKRASVAAGPRIGFAPGAGGALGALKAGGGGVAVPPALAPLPASAFSTSAFVTLPRGPVPVRLLVSTPFADAIRSATGVALESPLVAPASCFAGAGSPTSPDTGAPPPATGDPPPEA